MRTSRCQGLAFVRTVGSSGWLLPALVLLVGCAAGAVEQAEPVTSVSAVAECEARQPMFPEDGKPVSAADYVVRLTSEGSDDPAVAEQLARALESGRVGRADSQYFTPSGATAVGEGMSIFELVAGTEDCGTVLEIEVWVEPRSASLVFAEARLLQPRCDLALVRLILDREDWRIDEITPAGPDQLGVTCPVR